MRRQRLAVLAGLGAVVLLAWLYLLPAARDMYGDMSGLSAWMMQPRWDAPYAAAIFAMWVVMMVGMMLPSAAPAILLYGRVLRSNPEPQRPVARIYAFAAGYLLAWVAFSLAATLLQYLLARWHLLTPMMESGSTRFGGALFCAAGLYQWTALKRACLSRCRSPLAWLSRHWRAGLRGALAMGWQHGLYCLGCCALLMLLLFVGGVMNLWWIAGITLFVLLEKLAPYGAQGGRLSGLLLLAAGGWLLVFSPA